MNEPHPTIEIDAATLDRFVAAQRQTFKALVAFVLAGMLVAGLVIGFLIWRSYEYQTRQTCTAKLEGAAFSYAFDALAAPPVSPGATPGTKAFDESARGRAVNRGAVPAHQLRNIDAAC